MSTALSGARRHPVAAFVGRAHHALDAIAESGVWSMSADELGETLVDLARLKARVAELELRVLARAERVEVGAADGAASAAVWWAHRTRMTRAEGRRAARHAPRRLPRAGPRRARRRRPAGRPGGGDRRRR